MMVDMTFRRFVLFAALFLAAMLPVGARAGSSTDEEEVFPDARLEGYPPPRVAFEKPGGIAGSVVVVLMLTGITVGVMFINAKRSHLD